MTEPVVFERKQGPPITLAPGELVVEQFTTTPDSCGRTEFALHWRGYVPGVGDDVHLALHCNAVLGGYLRRARQRGQKVRHIFATVGGGCERETYPLHDGMAVPCGAAAAAEVRHIHGRWQRFCARHADEVVDQSRRRPLSATQSEGGERVLSRPAVVGPGVDGRLPLTVVVNGRPTWVEAELAGPLASIRQPALIQTGNAVGQPAECWEIRDGAGVLLDLTASVGSFGFNPLDTRLFLNLRAGVGG